jgi:dihydropteroate synthase
MVLYILRQKTLNSDFNLLMPNKPKYINIKGQLIDLEVPRVMGILNITPDSFYKGSRYLEEKEIIGAALSMLAEGADFLDIGGYSSRPGAENISSEEEENRVLSAVRYVSREFPDAIISVDTFRAEIARKAICDCGAHIVNDISGGDADPKMSELIAELNIPYIIMHMKGNPQNMQKDPVYEDVVSEILMWFGQKTVSLMAAGVKDIIIDPGFGFGKNVLHNFEILRRLGEFKIAGLPLMAGLSRKSLIWKTLGITPEESLNGTSVLNTVALLNGANILRVHDVKDAVESVKLILKVKNTLI